MTWFFAQVSAVLFILSVPSAFVAVLISCSGPVAAQEFQDCDDCPTMVVIPSGSFTMGSPSGEEGRDNDEGPQHSVTISNAFAVGKFEVTRGEYAAFISDTGRGSGDGCYTWTGSEWKKEASRNWRSPRFSQNDRHPVVCVNWEDAKAYVSWLSAKTGKTYRLLSEAEWEYVARAGSTSNRYWGSSADQICAYANGADRSTKQEFSERKVANCTDGYVYTSPVGSFEANGFGLADMLGNASEWTQDCVNDSYSGAPSKGFAWLSGECDRRVFRGGSWIWEPRDLRSAIRKWNSAHNRYNDVGFRLARTLN